MGLPLSNDLRFRALAAVDGGMSRRAAAERFGVSAASVIRWDQARRERGDPGPKPQGGDRRKEKIEDHADLIVSMLSERPDMTLEEMKAFLETHGVHFSTTTIWRFYHRSRITLKKRLGTPASRIAQTS
jgi:transposase